ncbi:MAG TPA: helix-turn-helix transcriptional regulator [Tepidisphaeraceae bacterium]|jgi:transcriptional regulator with XRE-family HTH domain
MEDAKTIFGRRLRTLRKSRGLTLEALGRAADIGFKHIALIEKAQKVPSFEAIDRLAAALGVAPYELFLPYDTDNAGLNEAFQRLTRSVASTGSPAFKRLLLTALPLFQQFETDATIRKGDQ